MGLGPVAAPWRTLVIHPTDPGLALFYRLRLKTAVPVARNGQQYLAIRALHAIDLNSVAAARLFRLCLGNGLIAQMRDQSGPEHPFHQTDLQFLHQTGFAEQIIRQPFSSSSRNSFEIDIVLAPLRKHAPDHDYTAGRTLSSV